MNNTPEQELEAKREAEKRAKELEAFISSITVGSKTTEQMCLCGQNPVTVVHPTKGRCCTSCANEK